MVKNLVKKKEYAGPGFAQFVASAAEYVAGGVLTVTSAGAVAAAEVCAREFRLNGVAAALCCAAGLKLCGGASVRLGGRGGLLTLRALSTDGDTEKPASCVGGSGFVMTKPVYASLLAAGNESGVCIEKGLFGMWRLVAYDPALFYRWADVPDGVFLLRGGCEVRVGKAEFLNYCAHVHVFPGKLTAGACYLRILAPTVRWSAFEVLQSRATVAALQAYLGSGVAGDAEWSVVSPGCVHVETCGSLPLGMPGDVLVGGSVEPGVKSLARKSSAVSLKASRLSSVVDNALGKLSLARGSSGGAAESSVETQAFGFDSVPPVPAVPPAWRPTHPSSDLAVGRGHFGLQAVSGLGLSSALDVATRNTNMDVSSVVEAGDCGASWVAALGSATPLGHYGRKFLSARKFAHIPPPAASGQAVVVAPVVPAGSDRVLRWRRLRTVLAGWNFEVAKLPKGRPCCTPAPADRVYARYELLVNGSVMVNGVLEVPGGTTVLWSRGLLSLSTAGVSGLLWRAWSDAGGCGLNPTLLAARELSRVPVALVANASVVVREVRVVGLDAPSPTAVAGVESAVGRCDDVPTVVDVVLAYPEVWRGKVVKLAFAHPTLQLVKCGGVLLRPAPAGVVTWVTVCSGAPVRVESLSAGPMVVRVDVAAEERAFRLAA